MTSKFAIFIRTEYIDGMTQRSFHECFSVKIAKADVVGLICQATSSSAMNADRKDKTEKIGILVFLLQI